MFREVGRTSALILALFVAQLSPKPVAGQNRANDEATIRDLVRREDAGQRPPVTDDAIFASGLTPQPLVGLAEQQRYFGQRSDSISAARPNEVGTTTVQRIVVSQSADLAYEFSNFSREWDAPGGGRSGFSGSLLRVWQKIDGQWHEVALFARPNDVP